MSEKKTWLSGMAGWQERGNIVETYWIGDPAIDQDASNGDRYLETLDAGALVVRDGETPQRIRVTLPDATQLLEIRSALQGSLEAGAATAFALCVGFPDLEDSGEIQREYRGGSFRLPLGFMHALVRDGEGASMVTTIGTWIWRRSLLDEQEKKASSAESTPKTS